MLRIALLIIVWRRDAPHVLCSERHPVDQILHRRDVDVSDVVSSNFESYWGNLKMFKRGTRLFSLATIMLLLIAVLHTFGLFSDPVDEEGIVLVQSMRGYKIDVGMGMHPSVYDVQMSLGLTMSIFMIFLAMLNFIVLYASPTAILFRRVTLLNAACMWSLAILYLTYQVFPPLMSFVVIGSLYTASLLRPPTEGFSGKAA